MQCKQCLLFVINELILFGGRVDGPALLLVIKIRQLIVDKAADLIVVCVLCESRAHLVAALLHADEERRAGYFRKAAVRRRINPLEQQHVHVAA